MKETRQISVVIDTSILIDLYKLDLVDPFFQLKLSVTTSLFVLNEITDSQQYLLFEQYIKSGVLRIDDPNEAQLSSAINQFQRVENKKLSLTDCCIIELTVRSNCELFTSDSRIREQSELNKVSCKGLVAVIEKMVYADVLENTAGIAKLEKYCINNIRAPKKECQDLIERLKN
jgi:rRNA maturation endonuclease Nob1